MMCAPIKLRALTRESLAFERIIDSMDNVMNVEVDEDESDAYVQLRKPMQNIERRLFYFKL